MTSTIKVNNVQNQCGQNIINENSNTITICLLYTYPSPRE